MLNKKKVTQLKKAKGKLDYIYVKNGIAYKVGEEFSIGFIVNMPDCVLLLLDFQKIVAKLNEPIFRYDDNKTVIKDGDREFVFDVSVDNIPDFDIPDKKLGEISKDDIKSYAKFCSKNDLRPAMNYIACTPDGMVATDAYRMKFDKRGVDKPFYIYRKIAKTLLNDHYEVYADDEYLYLKGEDQIIRHDLMDAKYPDWKSVLPSNKPKGYIRGDRKEFKEKVQLAKTMANNVTNKIGFSNGKITSEDLDNNKSFSDTIDMDDIEISFNAKFLLDIINDTDEDKIKISVFAPNRGAYVNENYLLMPIVNNYE